MNIVIENIDSSCRREVEELRGLTKHLLASQLITNVEIRADNPWEHCFPGSDDLSTYHVDIVTNPTHNVAVFVLPDEIRLIDYDDRLTAYIYLNRDNYARLEIV